LPENRTKTRTPVAEPLKMPVLPQSGGHYAALRDACDSCWNLSVAQAGLQQDWRGIVKPWQQRTFGKRSGPPRIVVTGVISVMIFRHRLEDMSMTTVMDFPTRTVAGPSVKYFYFYMALSCAAVAFLGFTPTYWLPIASGTFKANPIVHIHGLVFFSWTLFFSFQTWLAASGRIARHRTIGMVGISFATAMTIFGTLVAINSMKTAASRGLKDEGIAFAIVPLSGILFFAVVFTLAIGAVRRPETHKRLMLLATISLLDAAVARWFLTFLAPPGPPGQTSRSNHTTGARRLSAPSCRDHFRLAHARASACYLRVRWCGPCCSEGMNLPFSATPVWHSLAGGILALAQ
jgi:hypothetical protein